MKWALFSLAMVVCMTGTCVRGDDIAATQPASTPRFVMLPGSDATLAAGEQIELSVFDTRDQRTVDPTKALWLVDGQEPDKIDPSSGVFTIPKNAAGGTTVTFKAPASSPRKKSLTIEARLFQGGSLAKPTITITFAESPNWVTVDGDTGIEWHDVSIEIDRDDIATADDFRSRIGRNEPGYYVTIAARVKGEADAGVFLNVFLGPNSPPGTYHWRLGDPAIGATLLISARTAHATRYKWTALDSNHKPYALEGSTTLMKPDPAAPKIARGYFGGRMCWIDREDKAHYLTVRGHFAVPLHVFMTAQPAAPSKARGRG